MKRRTQDKDKVMFLYVSGSSHVFIIEFKCLKCLHREFSSALYLQEFRFKIHVLIVNIKLKHQRMPRVKNGVRKPRILL